MHKSQQNLGVNYLLEPLLEAQQVVLVVGVNGGEVHQLTLKVFSAREVESESDLATAHFE